MWPWGLFENPGLDICHFGSLSYAVSSSTASQSLLSPESCGKRSARLHSSAIESPRLCRHGPAAAQRQRTSLCTRTREQRPTCRRRPGHAPRCTHVRWSARAGMGRCRHRHGRGHRHEHRHGHGHGHGQTQAGTSRHSPSLAAQQPCCPTLPGCSPAHPGALPGPHLPLRGKAAQRAVTNLRDAAKDFHGKKTNKMFIVMK